MECFSKVSHCTRLNPRETYLVRSPLTRLKSCYLCRAPVMHTTNKGEHFHTLGVLVVQPIGLKKKQGEKEGLLDGHMQPHS